MAYNAFKINFGFNSSAASAISLYLADWSSYTGYNAAYVALFRKKVGTETSWTPSSGTSAFCTFWIPASGKTLWMTETMSEKYLYHVVVRRPGMAWKSQTFTAASGTTSGVTTFNLSNIGYGTLGIERKMMFCFNVSGSTGGDTTQYTYAVDYDTTTHSETTVTKVYLKDNYGVDTDDPSQVSFNTVANLQSYLPVGTVILFSDLTSFSTEWSSSPISTAYNRALANSHFKQTTVTGYGSDSYGAYVSVNTITFGSLVDDSMVVFKITKSTAQDTTKIPITSTTLVTNAYQNGSAVTNRYMFSSFFPAGTKLKVYRGSWSGGSVYDYDAAVAAGYPFDYFYDEEVVSFYQNTLTISNEIDRVTYEYYGERGSSNTQIIIEDNSAPHCKPGESIIICAADTYGSIINGYAANDYVQATVTTKNGNIITLNTAVPTSISSPYVFGKIADTVIIFADEWGNRVSESPVQGVLTGMPANRYITVGEFDSITEPFYNGSNPFYMPRKTPYYSQASGVGGGALQMAKKAEWSTTNSTTLATLYIRNAEMNGGSWVPCAKTSTINGTNITGDIPLNCPNEKVAILTGTTTQSAASDGIPSVSPYITWPYSGSTSGSCQVAFNFSGTTSFHRAQVALGIFSGSSRNMLLSYIIWNVNTARTSSGGITAYLYYPSTSDHNKIYYAGVAKNEDTRVYVSAAWRRLETASSVWGAWESARTNYDGSNTISIYSLGHGALTIYLYNSNAYWKAQATLTSTLSGTMPYVNNTGYTLTQALGRLEDMSESGITWDVTSVSTVMSNSVKSHSFVVNFTIPKKYGSSNFNSFSPYIVSDTWFGSSAGQNFTLTTATTAQTKTVTHNIPTTTCKVTVKLSVKVNFGNLGHCGGTATFTNSYNGSTKTANIPKQWWFGGKTYKNCATFTVEWPFQYINTTITPTVVIGEHTFTVSPSTFRFEDGATISLMATY